MSKKLSGVLGIIFFVLGFLTFPLKVLAAPPVPTGLTATATGATTVTVSWNASAGATSYNVYRGFEGGAKTRQGGPYPANGFADGNVQAAGTYCYEVTAINSTGESSRSAQACATVGGTSTPGTTNIQGAEIQQGESSSAAYTAYIVSFRPGVRITAGNSIKITFPKEFSYDPGSSNVAVSPANIRSSVDAGAVNSRPTVITLSITGTNTIAADTLVTVNVGNIQNPRLASNSEKNFIVSISRQTPQSNVDLSVKITPNAIPEPGTETPSCSVWNIACGLEAIWNAVTNLPTFLLSIGGQVISGFTTFLINLASGLLNEVISLTTEL